MTEAAALTHTQKEKDNNDLTQQSPNCDCELLGRFSYEMLHYILLTFIEPLLPQSNS